MPEGSPTPLKPLKADAPWQECVLGALLIAAILAVNTWTVRSTLPAEVRLFGGPKQGDYSNLTLDGFQSGHLYIPIAPPAALIHAEDPYNPAKRPPGVALSDVSLYKGHYYIYFGVAPVVTLFLPWRLLTGHDLPAPYAALFFVNGAFLVAVALFWGLRRRYFVGSSPAALATGIVMLGLASMGYAVLRRTSIWEPPVAAGYFFSSAALLCICSGLHGRRTLEWYAAAGLALGLAVGSRPTLAVGAAAFAAPLVAALAARDRKAGDAWRRLLALGLPFGAVLAGLLAYNFERFDDPFEFGLHYQLTGAYEAAVRHFSAAYVPFNAFVYYWAPAHWSRYFPFVGPIRLPPAPPGYDTSEYVYGMLTNVPFVGFAVLAPLALWRRRPEEKVPLAASLGAVAAFYVCVGCFLLFFVTSTARYMVDFAPTLVLLAAVGLLSAERRLTSRAARRALLLLAGAAAVYSAAVCLLLNAQLYDLLRLENPRLYGALAHAADTPVAWAERLAGTRFGPVEVTLRFPSGKQGMLEPLITTGSGIDSDYVFVKYLDARRVRLGFEHEGYALRWSEPIAVDFRAEHVLRANLGSLYPPRNHPLFDAWNNLAYGAACRWLTVSLDGAVVLDGPQDFYDGSPGSLRIGSEPIGTHGGAFTGTVLKVARVPFAPAFAPQDPCGPVALVLAVPHAPGLRQVPLLTSGTRGRADGVFLRTVGPGVVRFAYDHWGDPLLESADIAVGDTETHRLVVSTPDLWTDRAGADPRLRDHLYLELDGRVLAFQEVPAFGPRRGAVHFGSNAVGSTLSEGSYPWPIRSVAPVPLALPEHGDTGAPWTAPKEAGAVQREDVGWGTASTAWEVSRLVRTGAVWALFVAWMLLLIWICGRLSGLCWEAALRPVATRARRLWAPVRTHGVGISALVLACAFCWAALGIRQSYLRAAGPVHLRLALPQGYWGRAQTILATGRTGAGANFFIRYEDRGHVRVGADVWGTLNTMSAPVAVDYFEPLDVVINASGLYPPGHPLLHGMSPASLEALRGQITIDVNGQTVLRKSGSAFDSSVRDVTVGYTKLGFSYSEHAFAGRVLSAERLPVPHAFMVRKGQSLRLRFGMDPDTAEAQPLLSLGDGGFLGLLAVEPDVDGYGGLSLRRGRGAPVPVARFRDDPGAVHTLELVPGYVGGALPSLALRVELDGVQVADPRGFEAFDACPTLSAFSETAAPDVAAFYHGPTLESALQGEAEPVRGAGMAGPLLLVLQFPAGQTGADPLLVTGMTGAGDILYVQYMAEKGVRFGLDHWGTGGPIGDTVALDPQVPHHLEVETGALEYPGAGTKIAAPVRVRLDGVVVLEGMSPAFPYTAYQYAIGKNIIAGSTCGPEFRGQIWVAEREASPTAAGH